MYSIIEKIDIGEISYEQVGGGESQTLIFQVVAY